MLVLLCLARFPQCDGLRGHPVDPFLFWKAEYMYEPHFVYLSPADDHSGFCYLLVIEYEHGCAKFSCWALWLMPTWEAEIRVAV